MARPVTLFTGQWADLGVEEMVRKTHFFDLQSAIQDRRVVQLLRPVRKLQRTPPRRGSSRASNGLLLAKPKFRISSDMPL